MNAAHLHLMTNHIPVIGIPLAVLVLIWGLVRKEAAVERVGLVLLVLVALGTIPAYLSGDPAHELVEREPGVRRALIHEHEEAADFGFFFAEAIGVGALAALVLRKKYPKLAQRTSVATAAVGVFTFFVIARVALLGGDIRHVEIRTDALTRLINPQAATDTSNTVQERPRFRREGEDSAERGEASETP